MVKLDEHPTVKRYRAAAASREKPPHSSEVLKAEWLRQLCLEAGADDVGFVAIDRPEIDDQRFRRRPGRGHHAQRDVGQIVAIDDDLWSHFGSAEAVNDALRQIVASKKAAGS